MFTWCEHDMHIDMSTRHLVIRAREHLQHNSNLASSAQVNPFLLAKVVKIVIWLLVRLR